MAVWPHCGHRTERRRSATVGAQHSKLVCTSTEPCTVNAVGIVEVRCRTVIGSNRRQQHDVVRDADGRGDAQKHDSKWVGRCIVVQQACDLPFGRVGYKPPFGSGAERANTVAEVPVTAMK